MSGPIITSTGSILLGLFLVLSAKYMKEVFEFINLENYVIIFYAAGFVLISIGAIFFIYSLILKTIYPKEKPKEESKEVEVYVCPFCGDKLTSKEALEQHIEKFHKEGKKIIEDSKKLESKDFSIQNTINYKEY